jgi:hypothetical protein
MLDLVEAVNSRIAEASQRFPETTRRLRDLIDALNDGRVSEPVDERLLAGIGERVDSVLACARTAEIEESEFALCVLLYIGRLVQAGVLPHEAGLVIQ